MEITDKRIDNGKAFDWGRTSADYAKFRDIYPEEFYENIVSRGVCIKGQKVLDLGTGTGVLPRNMYKYGAEFTGIDISENQIIMAKQLAEDSGMNIRFESTPVEKMDFPSETFDVITSCQSFFYFDHNRISPVLSNILKKNGKLVVLYMAWLPYEDNIAGKSEELILKYNPEWTGAGETRHEIDVPDCVLDYFDVTYSNVFDINVPFTRESWNGRLKACRGVGASLPEDKVKQWENEHLRMLDEIADEEFNILHYAACIELTKKNI